MVPKAVYYALTNIEIDDDYITKAEVLKPKVVSKPKLVLYAEELGIRGKSLTKEVLLDRIIAAKIAKDMPVVAQAIRRDAALITDEIVDRVSERVSALTEEVQAVVEQRLSTGESVRPEAVADEIIAEQQKCQDLSIQCSMPSTIPPPSKCKDLSIQCSMPSTIPPPSRPATPPRTTRRRHPIFGVQHLKKPQCERNLKKDVIAAALDYGISIENKTIKQLCAEVEAAQRPMPIPATPPRTSPTSPMPTSRSSFRPSSKSTWDGPPTTPPRTTRRHLLFGVQHLKKAQCERNLKKDVIAAALDYGISIENKTIKQLCAEVEAAEAAQAAGARPMPIPATPPRAPSPIPSTIPSTIPPTIPSTIPPTLSTSSIEDASRIMYRSPMSSSAISSVANSVAVASDISNKVSEDIVKELAPSIDRSSVRRTIDELVEEEGLKLDLDESSLDEVVSDEKARVVVESVVSRAAEVGRISEEEKEEILQGLRDEASAFPASVPEPSGFGGARPKVPMAQTIRSRGESDIERLLREIQKPEESISNMALIQSRLFRCLGIVN
jgi:hypothetical protein